MNEGLEMQRIPSDLPKALQRYWGKEIVEYRKFPWEDRREKFASLSFASDSQKELVEFSMDLIREYLELPIIRDSFKTDEERAKWRAEIEKNDAEAFAAYEESALRMNKIANALAGVENLLPFIQWTRFEGLGALEAAHKEGLKNTIRIWKKTFPPDTAQKIEFVTEDVVPMLLHVYDVARATDYTAAPPKPSSEVIEFGRKEAA